MGRDATPSCGSRSLVRKRLRSHGTFCTNSQILAIVSLFLFHFPSLIVLLLDVIGVYVIEFPS